MIVAALQHAIAAAGLDGWLFFDHHRRDPLAYRILGLPDELQPTRRWYYFVPRSGEPSKLVHRIESRTLDTLLGEKQTYSGWVDQASGLRDILSGSNRVAMQYSPMCSIPYISLVDAGTIEAVRALGVQVLSSANLVQQFESRWTEAQLALHLQAGKRVDEVRRDAFDLIGECLRAKQGISDYEVQQFILGRFTELGLVTDHGPIVATNEHASDPHYEPTLETRVPIMSGDLVLIDLWAKLNDPDAVYYDITWTGYCGEDIPTEIQNVFDVVRTARVNACDFVKREVSNRRPLAGHQVDDAARSYIAEQGFGDFFFHRTGHSIGTEVHGTGANMDNLECHDERFVIANTCFSIEPGIYLPKFGIRSEVDMYVAETNAFVTGEEQDRLVRI